MTINQLSPINKANNVINNPIITESYSNLENLFESKYSDYISIEWKPSIYKPISKSKKVIYCSAIFIPTYNDCYVYFHIRTIFKFKFQASKPSSFLTFLSELSKFIKKNIKNSYDQIVMVFPSLSFLTAPHQNYLISTFSKDSSKQFSYSFKTYDDSLNPETFLFSHFSLILYKNTKINIVGLFEFFSCNSFLNISNHSLCNFLSNRYSNINSNPKILSSSIISFIYQLYIMIKHINKEFYKNFKMNHLFLANSLSHYSFSYFYTNTEKRKLDLCSFQHLPSYFLIHKASLSGLLMVNSIGNTPELSSYTYCKSISKIKKTYSKGPFYHYDVNSLYPYIMANYSLPSGKPKIYNIYKLIKEPKVFFETNLKNFFGFLEMEITLKDVSKSSDNYMFSHSSLPYILETEDGSSKTIFPVGKFSGVYFSPEIIHVINLGLVENITIYRAYNYKKMIIFDNIMNSIFKLRNPFINPYTHQAMKFFMNSFYGNLSLNPYKLTQIIHSDSDSEANPSLQNKLTFLNRKLHKNKYSTKKLPILRMRTFPEYSNNDFFQSYFHQAYAHESGKQCHKFIEKQLPHISAAIASYGRIFLSKTIYDNKLPVILCHTDSIITNKPLPQNYISSSIMGKFKLVAEYKTIFVKSLNQYIVKEKNSKRYTVIGHYSLADSDVYSKPREFIRRHINSIFQKNSPYFQKILNRNPILNSKNIPLTWTYPIKV